MALPSPRWYSHHVISKNNIVSHGRSWSSECSSLGLGLPSLGGVTGKTLLSIPNKAVLGSEALVTSSWGMWIFTIVENVCL